MCGIAGIVQMGCDRDNCDVVRRMVTTLAHRGPDEQGVWHRGAATLGHARLSILDLSTGQQPMSSPDGELCITFNGEIFNYVELREELAKRGHRFVTTSDTEVLLHAYEEFGDDCVEHLNGQWAFAVYDNRRRRLFLSRDRMGVRPLYWTRVGDAVLFASEAKALLADPTVARRLDIRGLDEVLTFWAPVAPRTVFEGISQLPPAHSMVVEDGQIRIRRYWQLELNPAIRDDAVSEERAAEELLERLRKATRIRMRADVPVGAYLSGGLDSTVTVALMRELTSGPLRTYSVSFDDAAFDESEYQREAAEFLDTEHYDVRCVAEQVAAALPAVVEHAETPIVRAAPAPLYLLSQLVRQHETKVVLSGEGADEVLGGYDIFKEAKIREFCQREAESNRRPTLLRRLYPYQPRLQQQPHAMLQKFFGEQEETAAPFFSHGPRWRLTSAVKAFYAPDVARELEAEDPVRELTAALPQQFTGLPVFQRAQLLESLQLLPGYIMSSQGDRVAMAHSIEMRHPFLDRDVVEFAASLPASLKMKVLNEKYLLKKAVRGKIPESIRRRQKQPYRAPDAECFQSAAGRRLAEEFLDPEPVIDSGIFKPAMVRRLTQKLAEGRAVGVKDSMAFCAILTTQILMKTFAAQAAKPMLTGEAA